MMTTWSLSEFPQSTGARERPSRAFHVARKPRGPGVCVSALAVIALALQFGAGISTPRASEGDPEIAALRREMSAMREAYERRLAELETRLAQLESAPASTSSPDGETTTSDELVRLRTAAREAAGVSATGRESPQPISGADLEPSIGHERNLNRLNPEISFTGDVVATTDGSNHDFVPREFELDLQASLDPFSTTKLTLAYEEEEVSIEEGYVAWSAIAPGLALRAGKFRQTFGALNRFHLHALPQVDYPLVLQSYFTDEGLAQTGVSLEWLMPRPWASANEVTFQLTDGSSDPFGGDSFERLAALIHVKNFWDLSPTTWFEWGLSGIGGSPESGQESRVWGSDVTLHWQPPSRAKYREFTWRTEVMLSQRDDPTNVRQDAWGGYSYVEGLARRNLYVGLRYDYVEDPLDPTVARWGLEPYVSWWQSEYVRLRAGYRTFKGDLTDETEHQFDLQLTWAAGPHKHESY